MGNMIDIEAIKEYNRQLKEKKEQASRLSTQVEFYTKELQSKCAELSRELGTEVNESNIEEKYNEYARKLEETLKTGTAVLQKIAQGDVASVEVPTQVPQQAMVAQVQHETIVQPQQVYGNQLGAQQYGQVMGTQPNVGVQPEVVQQTPASFVQPNNIPAGMQAFMTTPTI